MTDEQHLPNLDKVEEGLRELWRRLWGEEQTIAYNALGELSGWKYGPPDPPVEHMERAHLYRHRLDRPRRVDGDPGPPPMDYPELHDSPPPPPPDLKTVTTQVWRTQTGLIQFVVDDAPPEAITWTFLGHLNLFIEPYSGPMTPVQGPGKPEVVR